MADGDRWPQKEYSPRSQHKRLQKQEEIFNRFIKDSAGISANPPLGVEVPQVE